jgi:MFS family permease
MLEKVSILKDGISLTKRGLLLTIIFSTVFYTLYFVFSLYVIRYLSSSSDNRFLVQAAFNFVIVATLIVTSFIIDKINNLQTIYICLIVTAIFAASLYFVPIDILKLVGVFIIGSFFGIGQLAFLTYFWNLTMPEERGRVAGLNGFFSLLFYIIMYVTWVPTSDLQSSVAFVIVLSLAPLSTIFLKSKKALLTSKQNKIEYYPERRTILLYLIPWLLFSLINVTLASSTSFHISQQVSASSYFLLIALQLIAAVFGTIIGGTMSDFFGRRASLIFSLTFYGISSALAGFANNYVLYFVYLANGFSWGILLVMFTFVIWGDLSNERSAVKMYTIGLAISYLSQGVGLLPIEQTLQIPLVVSSLGSCLLIFFANIPIFLAPELLSNDFRERLKLKLHMKEVKKIEKNRRTKGK